MRFTDVGQSHCPLPRAPGLFRPGSTTSGVVEALSTGLRGGKCRTTGKPGRYDVDDYASPWSACSRPMASAGPHVVGNSQRRAGRRTFGRHPTGPCQPPRPDLQLGLFDETEDFQKLMVPQRHPRQRRQDPCATSSSIKAYHRSIHDRRGGRLLPLQRRLRPEVLHEDAKRLRAAHIGAELQRHPRAHPFDLGRRGPGHSVGVATSFTL